MSERSKGGLTPRDWLLTAAAAALYAALTIAFAPLSYGPVQVRLSECMVLLAFYHRKWIPGLTAGCFLANLASPFGAVDMVCGTAATFLALCAMRRCTSLFTASLCPVVSNGIIIGLELAWLADMPFSLTYLSLCMVWVMLGELLSVTLVGTALFRYLTMSRVLGRYIKK